MSVLILTNITARKYLNVDKLVPISNYIDIRKARNELKLHKIYLGIGATII